MKLSDFKRFFPALFKNAAEIYADTSHMHKRNPGKAIHFVYALLFGIGITASLWQHGSPAFTLAVLSSLLPVTCLLFVPYLFADTLLRRMAACGIFVGACSWIVFRLNNGIPFDLALVEGMILSSFSFLINAAKKDCNYLFLISLFLLIYAGLIPRKLLLFLVPGAAVTLMLISLAERESVLSGSSRLLKAAQYSVWRNIKRSWHLFVLYILIALPFFVFVLSFIPLQETKEDGFFEVSFITARNSALPPDLKKWLRQDKLAVKNPDGEDSMQDNKPDSSGKEGPKVDVPDVEAELDGSGRGSPPGKDLLFTVSMPVKLYHLAALYDMYDGKKWQLSSTLAKQRSNIFKRQRLAKYFTVESRYTVHKWISAVLCAPYSPIAYKLTEKDFASMHHFRLMRSLKTTGFNARFADPSKIPSLPFVYLATSRIQIPYLPRMEKVITPEQQGPEISTSFDEYLTRWTTQEKARLEKLRQAEEARQKRLAAIRERQRKLAEQRAKQQKIAAEKARRKRLAAEKKSKKLNKKTVVIKTPVKKSVVKKTIPSGKAFSKPVKKAKAPVLPARRITTPRPAYDPLWVETLSKSHYLKLPEKLSPKIAELGKSITKDKLLPYQKAIALRDYLRNNYTYRLYAERTPEDKESVAHFLFELKEGHCEYFAAALAVLARTQGLPSRVATGFSPGNYNALTRQFEVFEYHAHAWTQIYIDKIGWLTFDATPPSEIPSDTTPLGLGHFRNPFGEEWRVTPPELTENTLKFVKKIFDKETAENRARLEKRKAALQKEKTQSAKIRKKVNVRPGAKMPKLAQKPKSSGIVSYIQNKVSDLKEGLKRAASYLLLTRGGRILAVSVLAVAVLFFLFYRKVFHWVKKLCDRIRLCRCIKAYRESSDTEEKLHLLYCGTRLLLQAADISRTNNNELLHYAETAGSVFKQRYIKSYPESEDSEEKAKSFTLLLYCIFATYYALEYGKCRIREPELSQRFEDFIRLNTLLCEAHPRGLFFLEKLLFRKVMLCN